MKPFLLVASLALIGSGCDQMIARFTHMPPRINTAESARHSSPVLGEPGSVSAVGWAPSRDGRGFGVWTHQPAVDPQHCNEFNVEPAAETDDYGRLCETSIP